MPDYKTNISRGSSSYKHFVLLLFGKAVPQIYELNQVAMHGTG
jgi:hypothetical protein